MADYIDREAMLKQIERREHMLMGDKSISIAALKQFVRNRPAADVVPVVRCKDCGNGEDFAIGTERRRWCRLHHSAMQMDDFCSHGGKRKDDV